MQEAPILKGLMYGTTFVIIFLLKNKYFFPYGQSGLDSFCVQLYFPHTVQHTDIGRVVDKKGIMWLLTC
jgi:hypothetical protein